MFGNYIVDMIIPGAIELTAVNMAYENTVNDTQVLV